MYDVTNMLSIFHTFDKIPMFSYLNGTVSIGGGTMANIKSAIKRVRTNEKKRAQNQSIKSDMRSQIKKVEGLIQANDVESAKAELRIAKKKIDKTIQKGIIHKNNGIRQKARLEKKVNSL